jgi:hypothetical protein
VLIVVPLLARASYGIPWIAALVDKHLSSADPSSLFVRRTGPVPWGVASVFLAVCFFGSSRLLEGRFAQLLPEVVDTQALDKMVELHRDDPNAVIFHSYNWGGYLTWQGWRPHGPRLLNWIDDRNEVQGEQHIKDTFAILNATNPNWQESLAKAKVRFVCIEKSAPLAKALTERPEEWEKSYEDDFAVIFERRQHSDSSPNQSVR